MKAEKKRIVGVIGTVLMIAAALLVTDAGTLSTASVRGIAILAAALLMLITEPIPAGIVAPLLLVLLPLLDVVTFDQSLKNAMTTLFLFLMACYGISMVLLKSSIPERLAVFLLAKSQGRPLYVVGAFMLGTALISSVVSNVPCAVIMTGLAARVLHAMGEDMEKSPLGKAMMMSVPFGAVFGGMMTPAGSSLNVLAITLVEEATGQKVLFTEWIHQSVVRPVVDQEGTVKFLVAYVTLTSKYGNRSKLFLDKRKELKERLPSYMIPQKIIEMDVFPKNSSGKIDRYAMRLHHEKLYS
ncbi:SLC13 family permease [Proteiniclasticum ruminis]|uniref:SLC13 family permease n=1 Tax=Proteiniclasticum ruminis TaxID=398199 RepID=UPI0028ACBD39|nr:SLC13 family permease [Proteiniclasticum ruminis]